MSDVGVIFPLWFSAGLALLVALPVTTAIMAGLGVALYRIRRRDRARRLTGLRWVLAIVAPFWLVGLGFGGWTALNLLRHQVAQAQRYFTLDPAAEIDGISLPAGTRVELDDAKTLRVAELPEGSTLALQRALWRGKIEFTAPSHAPNAAHRAISEGTLAAAAAIDGIPCRAGSRVTFFWDGSLMECTLSQNTEAVATITAATGALAQRFACLAGDTIHMAGLRQGEVEGCRLAEASVFGEVTCAAGERLLVTDGDLSACTFARPTRFGPLVVPAGTAVTYYDRRPSNFRLPPGAADVEGFGLSLPAGTEGAFCADKDALARLVVSRIAYVMIGGIKLTGFIDFDCGAFRSGMLFEDAMVGGRWRQRGELVSPDDLATPKNG